MFSEKNSSSRCAFTLIELLTVIAIIGILAAIIIPTVGKVRESARAAQCVSNLRQLAVGFQLFAEDHRGRMVFNLGEPSRQNGTNSAYWPQHIRPYVTKIPFRNNDPLPDPFACPSSRAPNPSGAAAHFSRYSRTYHHADNYGFRLSNPVRHGFHFISRMSAPSQVLAAVCGQISETNQNAPRELGSGSAQRLSTRHGDRTNVLYYDWHVGKADRAAIMALEYTEGSRQLPWEDPS